MINRLLAAFLVVSVGLWVAWAYLIEMGTAAVLPLATGLLTLVVLWWWQRRRSA